MQVQDSINAANFLSIGMGATTKEAGNNADSDFASFLSTTDKSSDNNTDGVSAEKELFPERKNQDINKTSKSSEVKKSVNDNNDRSNYSDNRVIKAESESKNATTQKDQAITLEDGADGATVTVPVISDVTFDVDDVEEIVEMLGDIVQTVMNQLNISIEDVQNTLNDLGMDLPDLLTEEGEKNFFLNVKSADVSDLLTDETLRAELSDLISEITEISGDTSIDPAIVSSSFNNGLVTSEHVEEYINNISNELDEQPIVNDSDKETDNVVAMNNDESLDKRETIVEINVEDESLSKDTKERDSKPLEKKSHNYNTKTELQNTVMQGINDAVAAMEDIVDVSEGQLTKTSDVVEQIVEQVRVNINQENTSLEMQLYPEHLGRIQIHVISKDGVMTARIAAETEAAKQAIEAGLNNLKESLQNQNLKVDAIEVMVSTTAFAESNDQNKQYQQETNNKNGRTTGFGIEEEDDEEENDIAKMQAEGSSVSYRA